jgi:hypothetical protein
MALLGLARLAPPAYFEIMQIWESDLKLMKSSVQHFRILKLIEVNTNTVTILITIYSY